MTFQEKKKKQYTMLKIIQEDLTKIYLPTEQLPTDLPVYN